MITVLLLNCWTQGLKYILSSQNGPKGGPIALKQSQNPWPISSASRVVISSKVAACTSQPVAVIEHSCTRECLTGLRNKPQQKQTC